MTHSLSEELHAIAAGLVGGARYGFKIRLPHAMVMIWLFRRDLSSKQKMKTVGKLVVEHTTNLAAFAALYKTILAALKLASRRLHQGDNPRSDAGIFRTLGRILISLIVDGPARGQRLEHRPPGHPERSHHALVAGAIGGYIVWGRYSGVNYQIVLYLTSRVLVGLGKHLQEVYLPEGTVSFDQSYRLFAAVVWGLVMILFEERPNVLHPSLKKSMDEIYRYSIRENSALATPPTRTAAIEASQAPSQNASCASESKHACEKN